MYTRVASLRARSTQSPFARPERVWLPKGRDGCFHGFGCFGSTASRGAWCGRVLLNPESQFAHLAGGATVPEHRHRGYYSKLVATRLEAARLSSARFLSVTASPASEPALSKLGFRTVKKVTPWQVPETA